MSQPPNGWVQARGDKVETRSNYRSPAPSPATRCWAARRMGDATRLLQTHWTGSHLPSLHLTTLLTGTAAQRLGSGAGRSSKGTLKVVGPRPVALILPSEINPVLGRPTNGGRHQTLADSLDGKPSSSSAPDHASLWNGGPTARFRRGAVK